jgi:hypothetical protein
MRTDEAFYANGESTCQQTGDAESADDIAVADLAAKVKQAAGDRAVEALAEPLQMPRPQTKRIAATEQTPRKTPAKRLSPW